MFSLLNEESIFPRGSDQSLFNKFKAQIRAKEFKINPKSAKNEFQIAHYAGEVTYSTEGMLEKNKDTLWPDMVSLMEGSTQSIAATLLSFVQVWLYTSLHEFLKEDKLKIVYFYFS